MSANRPHSARVTDRARGYIKSQRIRALAPKMALDPRDAVLICSDPRGGSTWLSEILTPIPQSALLWEPLLPTQVPETASLGGSFRPWLAEHPVDSETDAAFGAFFDQLLSGGMLSPYLTSRTSVQALRDAERLIVKFCRANQLLPWLTQRYAFRRMPIYLHRHPCAVIASQMRYGAWEKMRPTIPDEQIDADPFLARHADKLRGITTREERLAAFWCMTNLDPLSHPKRSERWLTLSYEALITEPRTELARIEQAWGIELPAASYMAIETASTTTRGDSAISRGEKSAQLTQWQARLTPDQIDRILGVLDRFGIDLYGADPMPRRRS